MHARARAPACGVVMQAFLCSTPRAFISKGTRRSVALFFLLGWDCKLGPEASARRIMCGACGLWRIIAYEAVLAVRDDADWTCSQLRCAGGEAHSAAQQVPMIFLLPHLDCWALRKSWHVRKR